MTMKNAIEHSFGEGEGPTTPKLTNRLPPTLHSSSGVDTTPSNNHVEPYSEDCIGVAVSSNIPENKQSHFQPSNEAAIKIENVCKKYDDNHPVLINFNMTVPKGSIYALLGSSGCGKTTILSCVVGRQTWDTGTISVLGSPPSLKKFRIEPRRVGYMPQDLALQPLLTIRELLLLYGRLHGMSQDDIDTRWQFLQEFLQLPKEPKVIANLSGGQQRRASLAVALLHEPDLIILDEPTVGLDPLLRQSIWEHLQDLVTNLHVTIVLTTHYVDEARRSSMIGLMRHGRIIAEESPVNLMKKYGTESLDDIVLKICRRDANSKKANQKQQQQSNKLSSSGANSASVLEDPHENDEQRISEVVISSNRNPPPLDNNLKTVFYAKNKFAKLHEVAPVLPDCLEENGNITFLKYSNTLGAKLDSASEYDNFAVNSVVGSPSSPNQTSSSFATSFKKGFMGSVKSRRKCVRSSFAVFRRIRGLIWATYMATFRHIAFIPLTFLLPAITSALVQFVFGSDLHDLKFGFVNNDEPFSYYNQKNLSSFMAFQDGQDAKCLETTKFSHLFLKRIPADSLTLIPYPSKDDALKGVQAGDIWGFVHIPENYTEHMRQRMLTRQFSDNETIDGTIIGMHLDMSSFLGSILILKKLSAAYEGYLQNLAASCGLPAGEFELPLKYETPVYGDIDGTYGEHVVPGLLLVIIFVLPLGACSVSVIQERNQGCMSRMRVSGMAAYDIIITYYVTHGSFQIVQMTLCTVVLILGFSWVIQGPILLYVILNCCNAFAGLAIGFFLGLVCSTELHSLIIVFFIASILIPFSGAFWPIEALPSIWWRTLAYTLPTTLTAQSFRSVVFRGLGYTHRLVWPGLVIPVIWMCVFITFALLLLRKKY